MQEPSIDVTQNVKLAMLVIVRPCRARRIGGGWGASLLGPAKGELAPENRPERTIVLTDHR